MELLVNNEQISKSHVSTVLYQDSFKARNKSHI